MEWSASTKVRTAWIREHLAALVAPTKTKAFGPLATALVPAVLNDPAVDDYMNDIERLSSLGLDPEEIGWDNRRTQINKHVTAQVDTNPVGGLWLLLTCLLETSVFQVDAGHWSIDDDPDQLANVLAGWAWLESAGYSLSTPEKDRVAALTELAEAGGDDQ